MKFSLIYNHKKQGYDLYIYKWIGGRLWCATIDWIETYEGAEMLIAGFMRDVDVNIHRTLDKQSLFVSEVKD